jgi:hypothetical protein
MEQKRQNDELSRTYSMVEQQGVLLKIIKAMYTKPVPALYFTLFDLADELHSYGCSDIPKGDIAQIMISSGAFLQFDDHFSLCDPQALPMPVRVYHQYQQVKARVRLPKKER